MEKIRIRDKHPRSATLRAGLFYLEVVKILVNSN
jgi:hypothetical protein